MGWRPRGGGQLGQQSGGTKAVILLADPLVSVGALTEVEGCGGGGRERARSSSLNFSLTALRLRSLLSTDWDTALSDTVKNGSKLPSMESLAGLVRSKVEGA